MIFAFSYKKEFPNPLLERIKPIKNTSIILPDSISSQLKRELSALIVLKDLGCPSCLNEAVDFIDFASIRNDFDTAIWYMNKNKARVNNYHASINRNIPYSFGPITLVGQDTLIDYNKIIFFSNNSFSIISSIPVSSQVTSRELKNMMLKRINSLYNQNHK